MIISVFDIVENIVGKGENAGYQQFLLFPQCFEKASFPRMSKDVIVWEWVKKRPFENIVGKGENAECQCFYPSQREFLILRHI